MIDEVFGEGSTIPSLCKSNYIKERLSFVGPFGILQLLTIRIGPDAMMRRNSIARGAVFSMFLAGTLPVTAQELEITVDGSGLNIPHSYSVVPDANEPQRLDINISQMADDINAVLERTGAEVGRLNDDAFFAEVLSVLDDDKSDQAENPYGALRALATSTGLERAHFLELRELATAAVECKQEGGTVFPPDKPWLIRSQMNLRFNIDERNAENVVIREGTYGAQIDVASTKSQICIRASGGYSPIILNRRWIVNVENGGLQANEDVTGPGGKKYAFQLRAESTSVSLVSYSQSGKVIDARDPIYKQDATTCIDIFFTKVPPADGPLLISVPDDLTFCAGGTCKDRPPMLDATH